MGQRRALPSLTSGRAWPCPTNFCLRCSACARHQDGVAFYKRRLPHWQPEGADFFVTWRLYGSLPHGLKPFDDGGWRRMALPHGNSPLLLPSASPGMAFAAVDRRLDRAAKGPLWLRNPQVAECVSEILLLGAGQWRLYELLAWVIMANHVHVLMRPTVPLKKALMNVKSASARAANAILGRTGEHFWQDESFDRWMRNDRERARAIGYIEYNPVSAGLAATPEQWPWSSAGWRRRVQAS